MKKKILLSLLLLITPLFVSAHSKTSISLNSSWRFAEFSKINSGTATLYTNDNSNGYTVTINAGHGTKGGGSVKTLSHPDGTGKVTGGTNAEGEIYSTAVSSGMDFPNGTSEASVTLKLALKIKDVLLNNGYNVLMIRESSDVQLDNIARTVIANNNSDIHIAVHFDSTDSNKGAFYMSVPDKLKYLDNVASSWKESEKLGDTIIKAFKENGIKVFSSGSMDQDLTQTSYTEIPSIDLEYGDKQTDISDSNLEKMAEATVKGIANYFGESYEPTKTTTITENNGIKAHCPDEYHYKTPGTIVQSIKKGETMDQRYLSNSIAVNCSDGEYTDIYTINSTDIANEIIENEKNQIDINNYHLNDNEKAIVQRVMDNWPSQIQTDRLKLIDKGLSLIGIGLTYNDLDCSAYVAKVFNESGFSISATCTDEFARDSHFEQISIEELQPGDIALNSTTGGCNSNSTNHVGIYLGNYDGKNIYLHSTSSRNSQYDSSGPQIRTGEKNYKLFYRYKGFGNDTTSFTHNTNRTAEIVNIDIDWGEFADKEIDCNTIFLTNGELNELGKAVNEFFTLIKVIDPVLIIALSTMEYIKAITSNNADEMKKTNKRTIKRIVIGLVLFFLPDLLNLLFKIFGLYGIEICTM